MEKSKLFAAMIFCYAATSSQPIIADIVVPNGLSDGDSFRLVFVTSTVRNATSTNIADYDAFVTAAAESASLTTYNGQTISWHVIGSTATVDLRTRDPESPAGIFRVDGVKVSANFDSLWPANPLTPISLLAPISVDENGNSRTVRVYTGTFSNSISYPNGVLGAANGHVVVGSSAAKDSTWLQESVFSQNTTQFSMYGISQVLVVQSVPEPGSLVFCGLLALCGIATGIRQRILPRESTLGGFKGPDMACSLE